MIFDWTSPVYFGYEPEPAVRGHSRDGRPEECRTTMGVAQAAKPLCIPIGLTVMPGNTRDAGHMVRSYDRVKDDLRKDTDMISDAGASCKDVPDRIVLDGNSFLTRKKLNKSDDKPFRIFPEDTRRCIDEERGEYRLKKRTRSAMT